jgi:hypothetical protein
MFAAIVVEQEWSGADPDNGVPLGQPQPIRQLTVFVRGDEIIGRIDLGTCLTAGSS